MKKRFIWVLAGLMVVSMLGCGNKEEATTEETSQTTEATVEESETIEENQITVMADFSDEELANMLSLNDYKNMTIEASKTEVTDEAIESYINNYMLSTVEVTDRAVANGDIAVIDFTGYLNGEAFEGGSSTDFSLEIGSHSFIDGFEDGLIGVMPGETVDLDLTFPEDYQSANLAGQAVVFTVTVKSIQTYVTYAELTDEQLIAMNSIYSTKEELWEAGREALEAQYEESYKTTVSNSALDIILEESAFNEVPEYLVEQALADYIEYYEMLCTYYYGVDLSTFITAQYNMTVDEYKETMREPIADEVKKDIAIEAIGRAENLVPSEEEVLKEAQEYADTNGYESVDQLFEAGGKSAFVTYVTKLRVLDYLNEVSNIVEVTESVTE